MVGCAASAGTLLLLVASLAAGGREPATSREQPEGGVLERVAARQVDVSHLFPDLEATFVLLDTSAKRVTRHNPARAQQRFLPASTFKIPNSLIALETGVASGPEFTLAWDPVVARPQPWWPAGWRRDQTLRSAFQQSAAWYYQELARRIGPDRMQAYLGRFRYGNESIAGGVDRFWLSGGLRISPDEQVAFLHRFIAGGLGVSSRSTTILSEMMLIERTPEYVLWGKTGTAEITPTRELGWLVGFVERGGTTSIYALNIEGERVWEDWGPSTRKILVLAALQALGAIP